MTDVDGNLRNQAHFLRESQSRTIFISFRPHGWARFIIDDTLGALTIDSDWGSWSHVWGGGPSYWGTKTFTEFLRDRKAFHYLTDKLHYGGRTRELVDGDATKKALLKKVAEARRGTREYCYTTGKWKYFPRIDKDRAKELRRGINEYIYEIEDKPMDDNVWSAIRKVEEQDYVDGFGAFFDDMHDLIEMKPHPRLIFLRDQLLPVLVAVLNGEISDPNQGRVDVAAGQAGVAGELPGHGAQADEAVSDR